MTDKHVPTQGTSWRGGRRNVRARDREEALLSAVFPTQHAHHNHGHTAAAVTCTGSSQPDLGQR